ncbi:hypothetical protein E2562_024405, partial [Oryza meyeriana var. granulata]
CEQWQKAGAARLVAVTATAGATGHSSDMACGGAQGEQWRRRGRSACATRARMAGLEVGLVLVMACLVVG